MVLSSLYREGTGLTVATQFEAIPNSIKVLRSTMGLTQDQLAKEISVTRARLEQIENSKREPRLSEAQKLAKVLGASIEEIFPS